MKKLIDYLKRSYKEHPMDLGEKAVVIAFGFFTLVCLIALVIK